MRIHHIFSSAAHVHNSNIIRFFQDKCLETGTEWRDHCFALLSPPKPEALPLYDELHLESGQLRIAPEKTGDAYRMLRSISDEDCVVLHAAFFSWRFWLRLVCKPRLWKRTAWIMWGGDINNMKHYARHRSLKGMIYLSLAKIVVPRLGAISAMAPGDYDIVREVFGAKCDNYIRAFYALPCDVAVAVDHDPSESTGKDPVRILLGNSGDPDNCHLEAIGWLSRYRDEDIEVVCPLGYGGTQQYREEVIAAGRRSLGEKFRPVVDMLPSKEYVDLLDTIDILVFNHRRQQGLFNACYLLTQGKKAYMRHDATTYSMMRDFGIFVNDSCLLPEESFSQFAAPLPAEVNEANAKRCKERFSPDAAVDGWKQLFETFKA